ncbi:MAG: UvrD-helicase domain-containing protein [Clostridiales bacterium]|nr:UvrD-helicase domain-containing protein [Clostridiales bacterium]
MNHSEIAKEHEYLEEVFCLMKKQEADLTEKLSEKEKDIIVSRKEMFENTTSNIRDFDDVVELSMQNEIISEKTNDYGMIAESIKKLSELRISPYYGRVDFKDNTKNEYNSFYIGKYSFYDRDSLEYYIYDWRAPISSLFYDYDIGEASFETPKGLRCGEINLKRQYEIANGVIEYMNDTEAIAKDEVFAKVLSENTSKSLKVIISSIQKEQNIAIRYLKSKVLIIFGPAGSGKTSVGLHRLAYILYHNRKNISSKNVAVISNNDIFDSYISNIIPELGEDGINQFIFSKMIKPFIPKGYEEQNYYEQVNFLMNAHHQDIRIKGIEIKGSYDFLTFIEEFFQNMKLELYDLKFYKKTICNQKELENHFANDTDHISFKEKISRLHYFIETRYKDYFLLNKKRIKKKIENSSQDFLEPAQIESNYQSLMHENIVREKNAIIQRNNLDEISLYITILKKYLHENNLDDALLEQTLDNLHMKKLYHEDCIAVLCIKIMINKIDIDHTIKHVLIDEAQDYSLLQLFFIKNLFFHSNFTILGDTNQALHPFISTQNEEDFTKIFKDNMKKLYLNQSYRSTGPINKLSFGLLEKKNDIIYFNRSGKTPVFMKTKDLSGAVLKILKEYDSSKTLIGILVKTTQQAKSLFVELKDKIDVQLIIDPSDKMQKNIILLPVILAKGLEFDTVIADVNSNHQNSWDDKSILYLMSTRALHNLYLLSTNDLPEILSEHKSNIKIVEAF